MKVNRMNRELQMWCLNSNKHYYEKQHNLLVEANKSCKEKSNKYLIKSNYKGNNDVKNRKKIRNKSYGFDTQADTKLFLSFTQLFSLDRCPPNGTKYKEANNKTSMNYKKAHIDWGAEVEDILAFYRKNYTYLKSRVARTDKRELLRIAQEVQATNRIRRTCFPILKLPHNLVVKAPSPVKWNENFTNNNNPIANNIKHLLKKIDDNRQTVKKTPTVPPISATSCNTSITTKNTTTQNSPVHTTRPKRNTDKKKGNQQKDEPTKREFLQVKTINLSLEEVAKDKKVVLPQVRRATSMPPPARNTKVIAKEGNKPSLQDIANKYITKISMNSEQFTLTTKKKDGHLEQIKVLLPHTSHSGDYHCYDGEKIMDNDKDSVIFSTPSGTAFKMDKDIHRIPFNMCKEATKLPNMFSIVD